MTIENDKLPACLACPFCGYSGELNTIGAYSGVGCQTERAGVMCFGFRHALQYTSPAAAISAWNHRATVTAQGARPAVGAEPLSTLDKECLEIGRQLMRGAAELPELFELQVNIEKGAGTVDVYSDYGTKLSFDENGDNLSEVIKCAIDAAIAKGGV